MASSSALASAARAMMASVSTTDGGQPQGEICSQLFMLSCQLGEALWVVAAGKAGVPARDLPPAERPDGRADWQTWKALADAFCPASGNWSAGFGEKVAEGGELSGLLADLEGREQTEGDFPYHYAAQILRIPKREPCSLRRFLQVGFNLGQLTGSGGLYQVGSEFTAAYRRNEFDNPRLYIEDFTPFSAHAPGLERIRAAAECAMRGHAHLAAKLAAKLAAQLAAPSAALVPYLAVPLPAAAEAPQDDAPAAGGASGPLAVS